MSAASAANSQSPWSTYAGTKVPGLEGYPSNFYLGRSVVFRVVSLPPLWWGISFHGGGKPPIPGSSRFGAPEEAYLARRLTAPARNEHARYLVIRGLGSPVMYSTPSSHRFMAATRSSFVWYPHDEHL